MDRSACRLILIVSLFCILFVSAGAATRVGVYPGTEYIGVVERGETVSVDILLVGGKEGTRVSVRPTSPLLSAFEERERSYPFNPANASQESVKDWVEVLDAQTVLGPTQKFSIDGRSVAGNTRITYLLHVPEDAEPGYHVGALMPNVQSAKNSGDGMSIGTQTLSRHRFVFRVPGNAVRDGNILGFVGKRTDTDMESIYTVFKNTGTVTETVRVEPFVTYNNETIALSGAGASVKPGQIKRLRTVWSLGDAPTGQYPVGAQVSWLTGGTQKDGSITVAQHTETVKTANVGKDTSGSNDLLISVLSIVLVALAGREVWKRRSQN